MHSKSQRRKYLIITIIIFVLVIIFEIDRIKFLAIAQKTNGKVYKITMKNSSCGRQTYYKCTRYKAFITFSAKETGKSYNFKTDAGEDTRGHNIQPQDSIIKYKPGQEVTVLYDRNNPEYAFIECEDKGIIGFFTCSIH